MNSSTKSASELRPEKFKLAGVEIVGDNSWAVFVNGRTNRVFPIILSRQYSDAIISIIGSRNEDQASSRYDQSVYDLGPTFSFWCLLIACQCSIDDMAVSASETLGLEVKMSIKPPKEIGSRSYIIPTRLPEVAVLSAFDSAPITVCENPKRRISFDVPVNGSAAQVAKSVVLKIEEYLSRTENSGDPLANDPFV